MSKEYDEYLKQHRGDVRKGYYWIRNNLPEILEGIDISMDDLDWQIAIRHDHSKDLKDEYKPYDKYFYGNNKSHEVVNDFNIAWLKHIHRSPHHWQHWILIQDDPGKNELILDMPLHYIIEMVCDWWSFSWNKGKLDEIFTWYNQRKDHIKLSDKTRKTLEDILEKLHDKLEELGDI